MESLAPSARLGFRAVFKTRLRNGLARGGRSTRLLIAVSVNPCFASSDTWLPCIGEHGKMRRHKFVIWYSIVAKGKRTKLTRKARSLASLTW